MINANPLLHAYNPGEHAEGPGFCVFRASLLITEEVYEYIVDGNLLRINSQ